MQLNPLVKFGSHFLLFLPRSGFVVRPRGRRISTVKVRVGECHIFVAESNCVAVRRGEEQLEANNRSAAKRTRFGGMSRRAFSEMAKSENH